MSIEYYFNNDTKKQVVSSKKLDGYFEDNVALCAYLSMCIGDTIRITHEETEGYKFIEIYKYVPNCDENLLYEDDLEKLEKEVYA